MLCQRHGNGVPAWYASERVGPRLEDTNMSEAILEDVILPQIPAVNILTMQVVTCLFRLVLGGRFSSDLVARSQPLL
jgi:hypothetical protein